MKPFAVKVDMDDEASHTKAKVCYQEPDTAEREGRSAEITVYVNREGLHLAEISRAAIRGAEEFLRRILDGGGGSH